MVSFIVIIILKENKASHQTLPWRKAYIVPLVSYAKDLDVKSQDPYNLLRATKKKNRSVTVSGTALY
jgi:hypothetical protein